MLWIAALIAAQELPARPAAAVPRHVQATVRILRPAIITFETGEVTSDAGDAEARRSAVRLPDGSRQEAKLLEFQ